jgi:hypothetical protein
MRFSVFLTTMVVLVLAVGDVSDGAATGESGEVHDDGARTYEGRLSLQGNEPHTYLVLSTDAQVYRVVGPLAERLLRHQGQTVTVRGRIEQEGSMGRPADLRVMKILEAAPPSDSPPRRRN